MSAVDRPSRPGRPRDEEATAGVRRRLLSEVTHSPFGADRFGRTAERFARLFGTPQFILGQTVLVAVWIALNAVAVSMRWDPYPFILLNLAFSTQAAYAAPLILLAQTRQADRDKATATEDARRGELQRRHVEEQTGGLRDLLAVNTELTQRIARLTEEIHAAEYHRAHPDAPGGDGPLSDAGQSPPSRS